MIGILGILVVSWLLLHFLAKKNLLALGLLPPDKRIGQFLLGVFFVALLQIALLVMDTWFSRVTWVVNSLTGLDKYLDAAWYHFRSVLTEELVFRGALLYLLYKRFGAKWAVGISSLAFGLYHIVQYGAGDPVTMVHIVLVTGLAGFVWALAFVRTRSVMLPLGMHFAWNMMDTLFYTGGPFGRLLLVETSRTEPVWWFGHYLFKFYFPLLLMFLFVRFMIKKEPEIKYIEINEA